MTEQSEITKLIPYLNKGCLNKGYCMHKNPIIKQTNNGKRNVIKTNNINNLYFMLLLANRIRH